MPDVLSAGTTPVPVRSLSDLECSSGTVVHNTSREAVQSIFSEGLRGDEEHVYRGQTERFVKETLAASGDELPVDRQEAVFCWPILDKPFVPTGREVSLLISFDAIDAPVFAADFSLSTEVVCGYEESQLLHGVPPEENEELKAYVREYAASVTRVREWGDVQAAMEQHEQTELVVAKRISLSAFQAVGVPNEDSDSMVSDTGA